MISLKRIWTSMNFLSWFFFCCVVRGDESKPIVDKSSSSSDKDYKQHHSWIVLSYGSPSYDNVNSLESSSQSNNTVDTRDDPSFLRKKTRYLFEQESKNENDTTTSLDYGPGGWCGLCGTNDNYSCDRGIHEEHWNNGTRTFQDPTVCGATYVKVTVYGGDLGAVSLQVYLNDVLLGEQMWDGSPLCDTCTTAVFESKILRSHYMVGGENVFQLVPVGDDDVNLLPSICVDRVEMDFLQDDNCAPSAVPSDVPTVSPSIPPTSQPSSAPSDVPSTLAGRPFKITTVNPYRNDLSSSFCLSVKKIQKNQDVEIRPCCPGFDIRGGGASLGVLARTQNPNGSSSSSSSRNCKRAKDFQKQIWVFDDLYQMRLRDHPQYCISIQDKSKLKLDICNNHSDRNHEFVKKSKAVQTLSNHHSSSKGSGNSPSSSSSKPRSSKSSKSRIIQMTRAIFRTVLDSPFSTPMTLMVSEDSYTYLASKQKFIGFQKPPSIVSPDQCIKSKTKNKSSKRSSSRLLKKSKSCKSSKSQNKTFQKPIRLSVYDEMDDVAVIGKDIWEFEFEFSG